ncbi:MAG: NADPH:quinone reductase [Gammaproteobacteria bacterium]|nr:NADPH:quinone reductase [Gammaproteobacteria bacterium]MDH5310454.1 NADPH:quinone reductase [Gammaproteobacteria bacterium]
MRAAWFERFGPAREVLRVGELPDPEPGPGEVLVEVHASGVNPSDVKKRAGSAPNLLADGPVIPHSDGAGRIVAVGAGVSESRIGERVWVYQAQYGRRFGTAAELVALDSARAARLPEPASFDVGACMGIPAMTAHRTVFADGPVERQRVLVTGGAGRVGHYAIQWASQAGAFVVATASNTADEQACRAAGAVDVVDHREAGWGRRVLDATGGEKVDRVIDVEFGANLGEVLDCIETSGTIATYASMQQPEPRLPFPRMLYMDLNIRIVIVYAMPEPAKQAAIADIESALRENRLQHRVSARLPLDEIARSHELVERGVRGCVLVGLR